MDPYLLVGGSLALIALLMLAPAVYTWILDGPDSHEEVGR